jgi:hypothetical protein
MTKHIVFLICFFLVISCEKNEPALKGSKVEFSISAKEGLSGGRSKLETITGILVSIRNASGNMVYERENVPLHKFGEEYLSEPLALTIGDFDLTEFVIIDESGSAIYATPLEGSPLAHLVDDPLPINFAISKDVTTKVNPQVIKVDGNSGPDFGYATFSPNVVNTFSFLMGVMAYSPATDNFELTDSHVKITGSGETLFDMDLTAITNKIVIRDDFDNYHLTVTNGGYMPYDKIFTGEQLKEHASAPLVITLLMQSLSEGLIAFYPFDSSAEDRTANHFDGIVHEAVLTADRKGFPDAAYSFDGVNDYISVPHNDELNLPDDFTISLWANISSDQVPNEGINDILRKWNGNAEGYPFSISYLNQLADDFHEDKIIYVRYHGQGCGVPPEMYSPTIINDTFVHLVMIKEGNILRNYLNNVLIQETEDTELCPVGNTADMTIGCRGNLVRFFKGTIDDIRIYDRALNPAEVSSLYAE